METGNRSSLVNGIDYSNSLSLENGARAITLAYNWFPFQCSKIYKYEDHFFSVTECHVINLLLTKMAGYWSSSLFAFLWTSTSSRSIKTKKENSANIQLSRPRAWSIIHT